MKIVLDDPPRKLANLRPHNAIVGDADDLLRIRADQWQDDQNLESFPGHPYRRMAIRRDGIQVEQSRRRGDRTQFGSGHLADGQGSYPQYLHEIGRILAPPTEILAELRQSIGLKESEPSLAAIVDSAPGIGWTRDTFDRLIVAEAQSLNADW